MSELPGDKPHRAVVAVGTSWRGPSGRPQLIDFQRSMLVSTGTVVLDPSGERWKPGVLTTIRKHIPLIVGGAIVGGLLGYGVSFLLPTVYTSNASVYFSATAPFDPSGNAFGDATRFTADQVEIVQTSGVYEAAGARLVPPLTADEVRESTSAAGSVESSRMTITVSRPDPEEARVLANSVIAAYRAQAAFWVENASGVAQGAINNEQMKEEIRVLAAAYGDGVATVEPASLPTEPSAPVTRQNGMIGAIVGLLLAIATAVIRDQMRARRASVADLDMLIGAPLIARYEPPKSIAHEHVVRADPTPEQLQAVYDILSAIDVAFEGDAHPSVMFLSWQRALTTTSAVVATGIAAARAGRRVLLLDGGLKRYGISPLTDVQPGLGLEALADPETPVSSSVRTWTVDDVELKVVPLEGWAPTPTGAAARPQVLRSAISRLDDEVDLVLVDSPPLTDRSLGLALGRGVDGIVLVIDEATSIDDVHEMGRRVALAGVRIIGYVLARSERGGALSVLSPSSTRAHEGHVSLGATTGSRRS